MAQTTSMPVCSCCVPRLDAKVAYLRRPVLCATLRRSPLTCSTPVPLVARPPAAGCLAGISGRATRFKVTSVRRTCCKVPAAAGDPEHYGALILRLLPALPGLLIIAPHAISILNWYFRLLFYEIFIGLILRYSVPPVYKYIRRSYGTTVAMVRLAVYDPQRRLQRQLLEIVSRAYMSDLDTQHLILQGTADLLYCNHASMDYGYLEGHDRYIDPQSAEWLYGTFMSQARKAMAKSRARLEQRKTPSSLGSVWSDRAMEVQEQLTVVTLVVAARDMEPLPKPCWPPTAPKIVGVLEGLQNVSKENLVACQVLWTPLTKDTSYTSADVKEDYPDMKALEPRVGLHPCDPPRGYIVPVTKWRPGKNSAYRRDGCAAW